MGLGRLWDEQRLLGMYGRKGTGNSLSTQQPLNTFSRTRGGLDLDMSIVKCIAASFSRSGQVHRHARSAGQSAPVVGDHTKGFSPVHGTLRHLLSLAVNPKGLERDRKIVVNIAYKQKHFNYHPKMSGTQIFSVSSSTRKTAAICCKLFPLSLSCQYKAARTAHAKQPNHVQNSPSQRRK